MNFIVHTTFRYVSESSMVSFYNVSIIHKQKGLINLYTTSYYLIKVSRDHIPRQYGPYYGSNQGEI